MSRLSTQRTGLVGKLPRPFDLAHAMPLGEHSVAAVAKRDECVEREVNPRFAARFAALAEELPFQLSVAPLADVEEDVPVRLGERPPFKHVVETKPKRLFRPRPLVVERYSALAS